MQNLHIVIPFNSTLSHVCNYSEETQKILARNFTVLGVALGDPFSPWKNFSSFVKGEFLIRVSASQMIWKPIMFFPLQRVKLIKQLNIFLNILLLDSIFFWKKTQPLLWFFEPMNLSLFIRFFRHKKSVYDCVDYFLEKATEKEHIFLLKKANSVFVNSHSLSKKYLPFRKEIQTVELGFAVDQMPRFSLTTKKRKKKTFFFMGSIDWRIDIAFIKKLCTERKNDTIIFIGPQDFGSQHAAAHIKKQFNELVRSQKIEWIPGMSRQRLMRKVTQYDVGLVPYDTKIPFTRFSFPMKVMEYFYLGMPIISTSVEELTRYPESVYVPEHSGWAGLDSFLNKAETLTRKKQRRNQALQNSWEKKVSSILSSLSL